MELTLEQQLFNLGQFLNGRFKTVVSAFEAVVSAPNERASGIEELGSRGEFHEALSWLDLGVDLGYFPGEQVKLLVAHYQDLIFREHNRYIDLASSRLPTFVSKLREYEVLRSGPLSDLYVFDAPSELLSEYQTALLISDNLARDPVAGACMRAVTFLFDESWLKMQSEQMVAESVYFLLSPRAQSPGQRLDWDTNLLVAGTIQVLSHMETYKQFFEDLDGGVTGHSKDSNRFRLRVGGLQAWRLNLQNEATESRFHQQVEASATLVDSELKRLGHERDDAKHFLDVANDLIASWKSNVRAVTPATA